jgi:hypothetical protein
VCACFQGNGDDDGHEFMLQLALVDPLLHGNSDDEMAPVVPPPWLPRGRWMATCLSPLCNLMLCLICLVLLLDFIITYG